MSSTPSVAGLQYEVHGGREVFIPSLSIRVNSAGGVFTSSQPRNIAAGDWGEASTTRPLKNVMVPAELLELARRVTDLQAQLKEETEALRSAFELFSSPSPSPRTSRRLPPPRKWTFASIFSMQSQGPLSLDSFKS